MTTILRREHKFGDYLSQPDLAKFELRRKMSRPLIVNKAYEIEEETNIKNMDYSLDRTNLLISQKKNEKRKTGGNNKKYVKNINDIIANDNKHISNISTTTTTTSFTTASSNFNHQTLDNEDPPQVMQHDAIDKSELTATEIQENDIQMEENMPKHAQDIELEQQQLMNRMFNNPATFNTTFLPPLLMPIFVPNPEGGHYIIHLPIQPLQPQPTLNITNHTNHSMFYKATQSPTSDCSSISDEGFDDGYDSNDDSSLAEAFDEKLDISQELSEEESDDELNKLEQDEELNRIVSSIIDED